VSQTNLKLPSHGRRPVYYTAKPWLICANAVWWFISVFFSCFLSIHVCLSFAATILFLLRLAAAAAENDAHRVIPSVCADPSLVCHLHITSPTQKSSLWCCQPSFFGRSRLFQVLVANTMQLRWKPRVSCVKYAAFFNDFRVNSLSQAKIWVLFSRRRPTCNDCKTCSVSIAAVTTLHKIFYWWFKYRFYPQN